MVGLCLRQLPNIKVRKSNFIVNYNLQMTNILIPSILQSFSEYLNSNLVSFLSRSAFCETQISEDNLLVLFCYQANLSLVKLISLQRKIPVDQSKRRRLEYCQNLDMLLHTFSNNRSKVPSCQT